MKSGNKPVKDILGLKRTLDRFYREFDFRERLKHDPIEFPRRYPDPADIEIAGFIASCFAYGKVGLFKPVIKRILKPGGRRPSDFFTNFSLKKDGRRLSGISYRFNRERDVLCLVYLLSQALKKQGSLKNLLYSRYAAEHEDTGAAIAGFVDYFLKIDTSPVYGRNIKPYGLKQFFPSPARGSACKRMNLFLRWMVRDRDIDLGVWDTVPPARLIIPLDTHIARISKCLGLAQRSTADWKTAKQITESLKRLDPDDPLKYDFALCHHGISGACRGIKKPAPCCRTCEISIKQDLRHAYDMHHGKLLKDL